MQIPKSCLLLPILCSISDLIIFHPCSDLTCFSWNDLCPPILKTISVSTTYKSLCSGPYKSVSSALERDLSSDVWTILDSAGVLWLFRDADAASLQMKAHLNRQAWLQFALFQSMQYKRSHCFMSLRGRMGCCSWNWIVDRTRNWYEFVERLDLDCLLTKNALCRCENRMFKTCKDEWWTWVEPVRIQWSNKTKSFE